MQDDTNSINANQAQADYWNGEAGSKWVTNADNLDILLKPFLKAVIERAALKPGEAFADIGCGSGALTLAAASLVGSDGRAAGVDISAPLIGLAQHRAQAADADIHFKLADAAEGGFAARLDVLISRFGVMFFADPVTAFQAMRQTLKPGGRLAFSCWQAPKLNAWVSLPVRITKQHLHAQPVSPDPHAPGPFAFSDSDRLSTILSQAGFEEVEIDGFNKPLDIPGKSIEEAAEFLMHLGPAARLVEDYGGDLDAIFKGMVSALKEEWANKPHKLDARAWIVRAVNPA